MSRVTYAAFFCCAALLAGTPAQGQVRTDTLAYRLDSLQIAVTRAAVDPTRWPVAVSSVGRAGIQDARPLLGLDEALAGVPGLVISNRHNPSVGSRVVVRGLGARAAFGVRGLRVLVDGIPLTMPDGQTNLNNLDLGSAGSIHVLRGPASALFGNAAGGVIAVETEPAPGRLSADARVAVGDQDAGSLTRLARYQAKVGQTIGSLGYVASASHLEAGGYREHSRSRQSVFNGIARYDAGPDTELSLVLNAVDMPVAESPGALPLDSARLRPEMAWPNNARTRSGEAMRQVQLGGRIRRAFTRGTGDVSVYGIRRTLANPLPFGVIELGRTAGGVRASYDRQVSVQSALTAGFDLEAQRDDRLEFANEDGRAVGDPRRDQEDRVTSFGPFAQIRLARGAFGVVAGARYDALRFETIDRRAAPQDESGRRTLHAPSGMLGATYATGVGTLFGNLATSFQTPTTTELINAPPLPGAPCCPTGFNTALEPQRALSGEVGLRNASATWQYEVVAYRMAVTDALVAFQVPDVDGRDFFRNAGRTRHQGVELSGGRRLSRTVNLQAAYALTDVRFQADGDGAADHEGNRVPGIPTHQLYAAGTWSPEPASLSLEVRHTGRQYADDANSAVSPAYTVVDVRVEGQVDAGVATLSPFVLVNNVFDRAYYGSVTVNAFGGRYFEPAPGLNVHLGVRMRTGAWRR